MYRFDHDPALDVAEWIDSPRVRPVWEEAAKGNVAVSLPWVQVRHIPLLRSVIERFPTVPMVLRRFAGVAMEDGPPYEQGKDPCPSPVSEHLSRVLARQHQGSGEGEVHTAGVLRGTCIRNSEPTT